MKYKDEAITPRSKLRTAKFAFQHSEYESEIHPLKTAVRLTTLKLQQSESTDLSQQYQKWKSCARLLKKEKRRQSEWDNSSHQARFNKSLMLDVIMREFFTDTKVTDELMRSGRAVETRPFEITLRCERYSCTVNVILSLISRNRTNSLCLRRRYFTNQKCVFNRRF
jgi:hypothetical protein